MKQLAHLSLLLFSGIALSACGADDGDAAESQVFTVENVYGIWEAEAVMIGPNEIQGMEITVTESRILTKYERVVNPDTQDILQQKSHRCSSYTDLSVDDEAKGEYTVHGVMNLSFPSEGAQENVALDLSDDGQTVQVTTESDNGEGGLMLVQYEMQRAGSSSSIDDTSCASQE